jgi:hypothetical protein
MLDLSIVDLAQAEPGARAAAIVLAIRATVV